MVSYLIGLLKRDGKVRTRYGSVWSKVRLSDGASTISSGNLPSQIVLWMALRET